MVDALSGSRIHTTHKTYKNKLYSNTNITGLWEKISESFNVDNDKYNSAQNQIKLSDKSIEDNDKTKKYTYGNDHGTGGHHTSLKNQKKILNVFIEVVVNERHVTHVIHQLHYLTKGFLYV